jgi:hypothetical protein
VAAGVRTRYQALTDTQLRASAVPVSGPLTDAQLRAAVVPIGDGGGSITVDSPVGTPTWVRLSDGAAAFVGQKAMAASIPVVVASDQSVIPVSDNAGSITVDAPVGTPVFARLSDGAAVLIGQKAMAASLPVVIASDQSALPALAAGTNRIGSVRVVDSADADQTAAKGTQTSRFIGTQDAKDSGRVTIMWTAVFAFAQVAETLLTLTESRDGGAVTTFSTKVVTSGKRLRITSMLLEAETLGTGTTVPQRCYLRMRFNTAGAVTTASPLQFVGGVAAEPPAILKTAAWEAWSFPDGVEFLGDGTKQIGFTLETPDWVVTTQTGQAKVTITAFEY